MANSLQQPNGDWHPLKAQSTLAQAPKTKLLFQSGSHQQTYTLQTHITSVTPLSDLSDEDKLLFKSPQDASTSIFALTTEATIFHPQGGGQPSDTGHLSAILPPSTNDNATTSPDPFFQVLHVRTSITYPGKVLHFGHFTSSSSSSPPPSIPAQVLQTINSTQRHHFSRLHTAGHVLGAATRNLLEHRVANFDELKASHFPDSAGCEFQGLIEGKWKPEIQTAVDQLLETDAEVRIEWWRKREFRDRGLERLLPPAEVWREIGTWVDEEGTEVAAGGDADVDEETRIRVVNIVGAEVYPCGGTHVPTIKGCGKIGVRKITRQKGNSRVSYFVD